MKIITRCCWLLCGAVVLSGCQKKDDADANASHGASGATAVSAAVPTSTPAPIPTPVPVPKPVSHDADAAAVRACCAALRKAAEIEKNLATKGMYNASASVCDTQANNVKSGSITRGAAVSSIRGSMRGKTLPGACN